MDSSAMLELAGDFGRYQFMLLTLFSIINILSSAHYYSQTIITITPEHRCDVPELRNFSNDSPEVKKYLEGLKDPRCTKWATPTDDPRNYLEKELWTDQHLYQKAKVEKCTEGWVYTHDYGYKGMIAELNWVCSESWKPVVGQSLFFSGSVLGTLTLGIAADRVGRLPVMMVAQMLAMIGNVATAFVSDEISFAICRFVSGLATDSNFVMIYIIVMEYLSGSRRTLGLNLTIGVFYCLGSTAVPWIAVLLGDWKIFLIATALPLLIVPLFGFVVQESSEWLISRGRIEDAIACFRFVASFNRRHLPDDSVQLFRDANRILVSNQEKRDEERNLFRLLKTPRLRRNMLILLFKSMVLTLCYDAISRNVEGLGFPPFVVFSASAAAILPACLVLLLVQDSLGRKATAAGALLLSGIFTAGSGILLATGIASGNIMPLLLGVVGRFWVTVAYNSGAQYATELVPTPLRASGVATLHLAGYAAAFAGPNILYAGRVFAAFPSLLLGVLCVLCGVSCLFLPETSGRPLPATLAEGEDFGKGEGPLDFACWSYNRKKTKNKRQELIVSTIQVAGQSNTSM